MTARWCLEQGWTGVPDQADYERELRRLATPSYSATLRPYQEPPTHQLVPGKAPYDYGYCTTLICSRCSAPLLQGHMCVRVETPTGSYTRIIR